jgi:hypothetical protein
MGGGEMGFARVRISGQLLCELLPLPVGSRVVESEHSEGSGQVVVIVAHPDLPEVKEGVDGRPIISEAEPLFRTETDGRVEWVEWNVRKDS